MKIDRSIVDIVYLSMAIPNQITFKLTVFLFKILSFDARETIASYSRVTVSITNDIAPSPTPTTLTLHCKSKDDDLGFHNITYAESYKFSFRSRLPPFISTLFFCSFTWPESPQLHYLDIYSYKRDYCEYCSWKINKNGGTLLAEFYPWNKPIHGKVLN